MSVVPVLGFTFPSVVMTVVSLVLDVNPLRVLKVGMLVQLFTSFVHHWEHSCQEQIVEFFHNAVLHCGCDGAHGWWFPYANCAIGNFFMEQVKHYAGLAS